MEDKTIVKKNKNIVARVIGDEMVLVPVYKSSDEIDCIYTLNKVGARVWELLDGKSSIGEVKKELLKGFSSTEKEIEKELGMFLNDLKEAEAIN